MEPDNIKVELRDVSKTFASRNGFVTALDTTNLQVRAGEFVCLLGPSGCGKTTLLHLIAGLEQPTTGAVLIDRRVAPGIGKDRVMIFQDAALFPWLNVLGNVEFGLQMAGMEKNKRREIARHFLRRVHLSAFEQAAVHELSGGMKQRAALARALALDPDVLLLDEPFGALDAQTRDRLHDELQNIWQDTAKTILFVTHNVREAIVLGDRVVVLSPCPGRIKKEFGIDLPRPRHIESYAVVDLSREILAALKDESLEKARANENVGEEKDA